MAVSAMFINLITNDDKCLRSDVFSGIAISQVNKTYYVWSRRPIRYGCL